MADFARLNQERWSILPRALLAGAATGLVAVAFRSTLTFGEHLRTLAFASAHNSGWFGFLAMLLGIGSAIAVAVWLVRWYAPEASGSGIPHLKLVLAGRAPFRDLRVVIVKFASGLLGIAGGLGLGREGPTIQMGAAIASWIGRRWPSTTANATESLLISSGAAGLAAAFNAPLAGIVFALEELQIRFSHHAFFATAIAALTADVVSRSILGELPVFQIVLTHPPTITTLPFCVMVGAVAALLGILFTRLIVMAAQFGRSSGRRLAIGWAVVVLGITTLGWFSPVAVGSGLRLTDELLDGHFPLSALLAFLVVRLFLTAGSYALGSSGGIFAPMLLLGGILGAALGQIAAQMGIPQSPELAVWAVSGMAAMFGAVVRAPLTGIVLMVEMTGHYELVLPLFLSAFVGAGVADWLQEEPVYEALLAVGQNPHANATPELPK